MVSGIAASLGVSVSALAKAAEKFGGITQFA